jgi:hypothetical protein
VPECPTTVRLTTQDGVAEIIVGAGAGGHSRVRVYDGLGNLRRQFNAYTSGNINAPVHLIFREIADIPEIVTAQTNNGTSRQIRGFDALTGSLVDSFFEADPAYIGGIWLG